jgi:SAM-dependent methyltransferase
MGKYSYFSDEQTITRVGRWIVERQNVFILSMIEAHLGVHKKPSILEIGPGHGAFAKACKSRGFGYECVEANESMADRLRKDGFQVTVSTVPPLPEGDKRDVIVMQHVLEHVCGVEEALGLVRHCAKRLLPGGLLIIVCPDITVMKEDFFDCDYTHCFATSERRLGQLFHDGGFTVVASGLQNAFGTFPFLLRLIGICARFAYDLGIFRILFGEKAYTAKTSMYPSCYSVGRLNLGSIVGNGDHSRGHG